MGPAPLVLVAAALAGLTTLAAELLWMRALGRTLGASPETLAVVAGLVLAGLGLGAAVGARTATDSERPARAGGRCLLLAGALVALSPLYAGVVPGLHVGLLDALGLQGTGGALPILLLAIPPVLPAAWFLGMAFPYLVRTRVRDMRRAASRTGWIYACHTLGALLGVVGALVLLPHAGERMTLHLAGACALVGALLLLLCDRPLPHGSGPPQSAEPGRSLGAGPVGPILFVSGAAALIAQLAWVRMLQPLVGPQLWSMAFLLGPVLLGIALGAFAVGRIADRAQRAGLVLAGLLVAAGVLLFVSLPVAGGLPLRVWHATTQGAGARTASLIWGLCLVSGPAMLALGAALPLAVRVRADVSGSPASAAGRIYAWNTLGALGGGVLAGFVLLPRLGAERSLVIAGILMILAATTLRLRTVGGRRLVPAALHLVPLAILLWPGLLAGLLDSGPALPEIIAARKPAPPGLSLADRDDLALYATWFAGRPASRPQDASGAVLPTFDGRAGRVELIEEPDGRVGLRRGALREAVFDPDDPNRPAPMETALGLIPGLIHIAPSRAAVIGHGAGWTVEALLAVGVEQLDVAELDRAVLRAARRYRGARQLPAERDPRVRLLEMDGRLLLRRAARRPREERYNLIVSQPSHPWSSVAAHLFTQEAYETAHAALHESGLMAQWLNLFDLTPALLRRALGAFRAVFDDVWVFRFPGELLLVGSTRPLVLSPEHRWERLLVGDGPCAQLATAAGFRDPGALLKHFALDTAGLDRVLGPERESLHDDRPQLEYEVAWRRLMGTRTEDSERILLAGFPPDLAAVLPDSTRRERWLTQAVLAWLRDGYPDEARQWSRKLRWGASPDGKAAQARAALAGGEWVHAAGLLARAREQAPERGDLAARWIDALTSGAAEDQAPRDFLTRVDAVAARFPRDGRVLAAAARAHRGVGGAERARVLFEQAMAASEPEAPPGTGMHLARLLLSTPGRPGVAKRALALLARDASTYERIDALDLYVRLASQLGDEKTAATLDAALRTLEDARGLSLFRTAAGHLARHEFDDAVRTADECCTVWAARSTAWELQGLALLAADAARRARTSSTQADLTDAVKAFVEAVERDHEPEAATERVRRMLRWFGHPSRAFEEALAGRLP